MTTRFVLASASPARLTLLRSAGFRPEVIVSGVDETGVSAADVPSLCLDLATRKADAVVAGLTAPGLVLGCDSLLELDGQALGRPADAEAALARWAMMAGRAGTLHTGHCLVDSATARRSAAVSSTIVHFGMPTRRELAAYVATGEPLRVAGAFTIDGYGGAFVDGIEGDPGTVIGVSLPLLRGLLADVDVPITDLWAPP